VENPQFTRDYYDPAKRFIGNAVQVYFRGGRATRRIAVDYPIGHRLRRAEGLPILRQKFEAGVRGHFGAEQAERIIKMFADRTALEGMAANDMVTALVHTGVN
jgi:2-methylcitrate dehydratase